LCFSVDKEEGSNVKSISIITAATDGSDSSIDAVARRTIIDIQVLLTAQEQEAYIWSESEKPELISLEVQVCLLAILTRKISI